jgi:hypothetical protein
MTFKHARAIWVSTPAVWHSLFSAINSEVGLRGGFFRGSPAYASRFAPEGHVCLIDPGAVALALGTLTIDTSSVTALAMDSLPAMDTGAGSPDTPSAAKACRAPTA